MIRDDLRAYPIDVASKISGASPRQIRYWAKTGLVAIDLDQKVGRRRVRLWDFQGLIELSVVMEMLRRNCSLQAIRKVVEFIRERDQLDRPLSQVAFYVDRESGEIAWVDADGSVEGARRPGQTVMREVINLERIRAAIRSHPLRDAQAYGRIESHRGVMGSKPVFSGTRTPVAALASYFARNVPTERILEAFPHLTSDDVEAARQHLSAA
ncbi:MAG: DUF433 domain-containing protein [Nitriliruptoraceae bacterium]